MAVPTTQRMAFQQPPSSVYQQKWKSLPKLAASPYLRSVHGTKTPLLRSEGCGLRQGICPRPRSVGWSAREQEDAERATNKWIDEYIIGLDLCPFAKPARQQTRVQICAGESLQAYLDDLQEELEILALEDEGKPSTTVLVLSPGIAGDFSIFMDQFLEAGIETVAATGLSESIQLVPFHPKAQYSEAPDDCSDYALRSPFPTIHLLRQCDVDRAIAALAEKGMFTSEISDSNAARLQGLGTAALETIMRGLTLQPDNDDAPDNGARG